MPLKVLVTKTAVGNLHKVGAEYVFNYTPATNKHNFISLTMPVREKSYLSYQLHPIFEMHLPEGYLLAIFKKHFAKLTATDDLGLLQLLSNSVRGRVEYQTQNLSNLQPLLLDDLLNPNENLFNELVTRFALNSPLSGVQPKVLARIENKATLKLDDYIVKSWGEDYPELALNEFFCMQAIKKAGIKVPQFYLSSDDKLFIMKRFDIVNDKYLGFEDLCVLQAKNRDDKYKGSYEQVAKTLSIFTSSHLKSKSLSQFFKMIVMNNLLQNGDAHLKNFGVIYENINEIRIAPAYDIISTTAYIQHDIPALNLFGSKKWQTKEKLIKFGIKFCSLTNKQASAMYQDCLQAMEYLNNLVNLRLKNEKNINKRSILLHLKKLSAS